MKGTYLPRPAVASTTRSKKLGFLQLLGCFSIAALFFFWNHLPNPSISTLVSSKKHKFQKCSIDTYLATGLKFLKTAERPPLEEYILRRNNLAKALVADGVDAFVVEPGYTFSYYANVTQPQWEVWEPEERPFLMVIQPHELPNGSIIANTSFLVPHFEELRAQLLNMPFPGPISTIIYEEHWNYYTTLRNASIWPSNTPSPVLMMDEEMRDFIPRGLATADFTVVGLKGETEAVRQVKTPLEIGILRAVNTGTVEAIRAMRKCLPYGLTENDVAEVLDNTLRAAGMEPFFDIVEFGESAALPHGGYDGTKKLEEGEFVLIDVGAHLFGYSSDVCRTFYPPQFSLDDVDGQGKKNVTQQLEVWDVVLAAQSASVKAMQTNATAASVDIAARDIITQAGYGAQFTHRLGHSLGIKAHESPYLNKGNTGVRLRPGMVFTSEPGVYVLGEFGVRHEDILVVREEGEEAENISGGFSRSAWEP
ncbi:peptidase M24 [Paraphoma chrysanthemicola]|nr:peptidase M24 [Paraphoma chrysanthemicola]